MTETRYDQAAARRAASRKMRRLPLLVGAVALLVGTGMGNASATPTDTDALTSESTIPTPNVFTQFLVNHTDQSLTGEWHVQRGDSTASIDLSTPLPSGQYRSRGLVPNPIEISPRSTYTWGRVCYNKSWWNLPRAEYGGGLADAGGQSQRTMWVENDYSGKLVTSFATDVKDWHLTVPMVETEHGAVTCPQ
ncbi:hypothetical protein [Rhodococcus jostii]|uniref:hypothetical protein n=1 Tax=Rhodococcus jostii TaxID=132919 RepID=UPI00362AA407